jgi:hypothetical protein
MLDSNIYLISLSTMFKLAALLAEQVSGTVKTSSGMSERALRNPIP